MHDCGAGGDGAAAAADTTKAAAVAIKRRCFDTADADTFAAIAANVTFTASHRYFLVGIHQEQFISFLLRFFILYFSMLAVGARVLPLLPTPSPPPLSLKVFFLTAPKIDNGEFKRGHTNQMRINRNNNIESV